jgi:hopanoid biosynthesis associated protein HpnK
VTGSDSRIIFTADDFGLSEAVNEGIERAHREGVLTHASLMVAGAAAADAVRRARRMPGLRVGLHLVTVEGPATLPPDVIPDLVDRRGWFPSDQVRLGLRYFFLPYVRRQLAAEIRAQFAAFAATGLTLDHADAHKHMHMHPTVGRLMLRIGLEFGLPRIRVPTEPPRVLAACGSPVGLGGRTLHAWSRILRRQAQAAGVAVDDAVFGLAWSGHMTEARVLRLLANRPDGSCELYFHPASRRDALLARLMPGYEHPAELAALLSPAVRNALNISGAHAGPAAGPVRTPVSQAPSQQG